MKDHPQRFNIANETHARPHMPLAAPLEASHYAFMTPEGEYERDREHLLLLCERYGLDHPAPGASQVALNVEGMRLRWERHTEFTSYTLISEREFDEPFANALVARLPAEWWDGIPGELLVAAHLALTPVGSAPPDAPLLDRLFAIDTLCASSVYQGSGTVWSDLRLHGDGASRWLVQDEGLSGGQTGRLVQRLLELETYRSLALLSLPLARQVGPQVRAIDLRLEGLTAGLGTANALDEQKRLLAELTDMWAELERLTALTAYRFSATAAYEALVRSRSALLAEQASPEQQSINSFMMRRFEPAIRTCTSLAERQEALSTRLTRTANLLRTRVDVVVEEQNSELLASMNRRTRLQLRLQETVEGLSVAAITYYAVGLVGYIGKAMLQAGLAVDVAMLQGISVPLLAGGVWLFVRRVRRGLDEPG